MKFAKIFAIYRQSPNDISLSPTGFEIRQIGNISPKLATLDDRGGGGGRGQHLSVQFSPSGHVDRVVTLASDVIEDGADRTASQLGRDAVQADVEQSTVIGVQVGRVVVPVAVGVHRLGGIQRTREVADLCDGGTWYQPEQVSGHRMLRRLRRLFTKPKQGQRTYDLLPKTTPKLGRAGLSFCFYRNQEDKFYHL